MGRQEAKGTRWEIVLGDFIKQEELEKLKQVTASTQTQEEEKQA